MEAHTWKIIVEDNVSMLSRVDTITEYCSVFSHKVMHCEQPGFCGGLDTQTDLQQLTHNVEATIIKSILLKQSLKETEKPGINHDHSYNLRLFVDHFYNIVNC